MAFVQIKSEVDGEDGRRHDEGLMLGFIGRVDDDIVNVDKTALALQVTKHLLHQALEGHCSILQPKRHPL